MWSRADRLVSKDCAHGDMSESLFTNKVLNIDKLDEFSLCSKMIRVLRLTAAGFELSG